MTAFALYRLPAAADALLVRGREISFDPERIPSNAFLLQPFQKELEGAAILAESVTSCAPTQRPDLPWQRFMQKNENGNAAASDYQSLVSRGISAIQDGMLQKVVLSRKAKVGAPEGFDPVKLWQALCAAYPQAFVWLCGTERFGLWIGATPELLLHRNGQHLQTVALAGTLRNFADSFSEKEQREQGLVTEYIREKLAPFAEELFITEPGLQHAGRLTHLVSRIEAELKPDTTTEELIRRLHPTPAVCGVPEEAAYRFILENEGYQRGLYSGFIGPVSEDETHLFVNLRCAQITAGDIHLYAGAGIVEGSDPQQEWLETEAKMETLRRFLVV